MGDEKKQAKQAEWLGRPISHEDHGHDLEREAAIHEFGNHLPRHEAEEKAYDGYKKEQHARAAAHHLQGMKAAQAAGNMDEARKHGMMYDQHLKGLGHHSSVGPVPHDVERYVRESDKGPYSFKNHGADSFLVEKKEEPMAEELKKSHEEHEHEEHHEGPSCPMCGGDAEHLGGLGNRSHHRCRNCGVGFSVDASLAHPAPENHPDHQKSEGLTHEDGHLLYKAVKGLLDASLAKKAKE